MIFCQNVDKPKKMTVAGQGICQSIHWLKCNNHVLHSKNHHCQHPPIFRDCTAHNSWQGGSDLSRGAQPP